MEIVTQALFAKGQATQVIAIELPRSHAFMHLDTVMTMIENRLHTIKAVMVATLGR